MNSKIEKKKKADLYLNKLEEKLKYYKQVVIDSSEAVIIQDFNGIVKAWNKSAEKIYGFMAKEMIGKNITKIISKKDRLNAVKNIRAIQKGKPTFRIQQTRITKNGQEVSVNITYSPIYESNEIIEIGTMGEDVSDLKKSEIEFKEIFENNRDGLILADIKTKKFVKANNQICKMLGYSKKELLNLGVKNIHPKKDLSFVISKFVKQSKGQLKEPVVLPMLRKDKTIFNAEVQASPILNKREYILGAFRDITSRIIAEEKLKESEEKYKTLVENAFNYIYNIDSNYKVVSANNAARKLFSFKYKNIVGKKITELFPKEISKGYMLSLKKVFDTGEPLSISGSKMIVGDNLSWLTVALSPIKNSKGDVISVIGVSHDLTSEVEAENKIKKEKMRYELVIKNTGSLVYEYNFETGNIEWRGAIKKLVGYSEEEFQKIGIKKWEKMIHPEDRWVALSLLKKSEKEKKNYSMDYRFKRKDGTYFWVNDTGDFIYNENGNAESMVGIMKDISVKKKWQEDLEKAYLNLQNIEELKSNAIRDVAHEFKSPVSKIRMFSSLLIEEINKLNGNKKNALEYANYLIKNSNQFLYDIQRVLGLSKLQNLTSVKKEKINFCNVVDKILQGYVSTIKKKDLELKINLKDHTIFRGNSKFIEELIKNLIENAIKFTKKGFIEINCCKFDNSIIFSVKDSGRGIAEGDFGKLFVPFKQLDTSVPGMGVGLSSVKKIVELHNGTIGIKSQLGKGTEFIIKIPLNQNEKK